MYFRTVDFLNVMTYDFHGTWDAAAGAYSHAELFPDIVSTANCSHYETFGATRRLRSKTPREELPRFYSFVDYN